MSGDFKVGDVVKHKRTRECMTVTKTETDLLIHCEGLQNETKFLGCISTRRTRTMSSAYL